MIVEFEHQQVTIKGDKRDYSLYLVTGHDEIKFIVLFAKSESKLHFKLLIQFALTPNGF